MSLPRLEMGSLISISIKMAGDRTMSCIAEMVAFSRAMHCLKYFGGFAFRIQTSVRFRASYIEDTSSKRFEFECALSNCL